MNTLYELEMNHSNNSHLNILDLPDEILFIVFKKLNMVDVAYSLVDVNQRFDRLAVDSLYVRNLNMTNIMNINSLYDQTSSMDTQVLFKICQKIVPRIHHQVHKLTIDQYSMKQILVAASYPQLYSLSIINFRDEILYQYLIDDLILRDLLSKQITHLNIDIEETSKRYSITVSNIFALILSLCKKLTVLNFCNMFPTRQCSTPMPYISSISHMSSTLIKLKINVPHIHDCLYLLDGRLDSLSTLIINVSDLFDSIVDRVSRTTLAKLKCFSFTAFTLTFDYDTVIVPLLRQMINLEELKLYLSVYRRHSAYIDGIQLHNQFLKYMTHLKKFTFNIKTELCHVNNIVELQSNEDIQRSFIGRDYQQVSSYIHTISMDDESVCHIYSLPYEFDYFVDLNNSFQDGMFHKVRYLTMDDTISFEHKFFQLISQDFPFLQFLNIFNTEPQKDKQYSSTSITFPYLTFLNLKSAHKDYAKLFLLGKNVYLPRLLNLGIKYESLRRITNNFATDPMHFNFTTLKSLDLRLNRPFVYPDNFYTYFPFL